MEQQLYMKGISTPKKDDQWKAIEEMKTAGKSYTAIARELSRDGQHISRQRVQQIYAKIMTRKGIGLPKYVPKNVHDSPASGRRRVQVTKVDVDTALKVPQEALDSLLK